MLYKERLNGTKTVVNRVVGEVRGKSCVIIDDMISTGGTIKNTIEALIQAGSSDSFIVAAAHAVFTPQARRNLNHPGIRHIVVTDSIPISADECSGSGRIKTVSLAAILAAAIHGRE